MLRTCDGTNPTRSVFFPGSQASELEELLSNAALFVLPSEIEGMSLALLDAMAAGVCVLTSDIPENKEVVEGAGFTFHRGDQADLERMLDLLIHDPGTSPSVRHSRTGADAQSVSLARDCTQHRKRLLRCAGLVFERGYG